MVRAVPDFLKDNVISNTNDVYVGGTTRKGQSVCFTPGEGCIEIKGLFTTDELRDIVWMMDSNK